MVSEEVVSKLKELKSKVVQPQMMKIYISPLSAYIARDHACGLFCTGCLQSYLPRPSSRVVDHTTEFP